MSSPRELFQLEDAYEVRYGWLRSDTWQVPSSLLIAAAAVVPWAAGNRHALIPALLALAFPVLRLRQIAARRTAVRIGHDGLTVGRQWPWPEERAFTVPWHDITAVHLWGQARARSPERIGLALREHAPLPPGAQRWRRPRGAATLASLYALPDDVALSIPVDVRLDPERLTAAVRRHAPQVEIIDSY